MREFDQTSGFKVNIHQSQVFLYANKERSESERNFLKITFALATRKIKYLGINLTKEVKNLYSENYTTLKKEIKEDTNKLKHIPCSQIGRINIIKCPYYPKQFIESMQSLLKYERHISQIQNKHFKNLYGTVNDPQQLQQF